MSMFQRGYFGAIILSALVFSFIGAFALRSVFAQPSGPASCVNDADCPVDQYCLAGKCNVPPPIWNSKGIIGLNQDAQFNITGPAHILSSSGGNAELKIKSTEGDNDHWGIYYDRGTKELRFWKDDNRLILTTDGDLTTSGCFGPVFVGLTSVSYQGDNGGYTGAHSLCSQIFNGSHTCSTEELLQSIKCGNDAILQTSGFAWVLNGPPAYLAQANDCKGRTSSESNVYGAMWEFSSQGGKGHLTGCNTSRVFACCK